MMESKKKDKELNEKQKKFLLAISMDKKECIRTLGRSIYLTDVSAYAARNILLHLNLITLNKVKNKEIPHLTIKGKKMVEDIYSKRTDMSKKGNI